LTTSVWFPLHEGYALTKNNISQVKDRGIERRATCSGINATVVIICLCSPASQSILPV